MPGPILCIGCLGRRDLHDKFFGDCAVHDCTARARLPYLANRAQAWRKLPSKGRLGGTANAPALAQLRGDRRQ
jgi:hypothetical protein